MSVQVVGPREKAITVSLLDTTAAAALSDTFDIGPYAAGTIQVIVDAGAVGVALTIEHSNDADPASFIQMPKFDGTLSGTISANTMVPVSGSRFVRVNKTAGSGHVRVVGNFSLQN